MIRWLRTLFSTPTFEDAEKNRAAQLLRATLSTIALFAIVAPLIITFFEPGNAAENIASGVITLIVMGVLWLLQRFQRLQLASILLLILLLGLFTFGIYQFNGIRSTSITGFIFIVLMAGLLVGQEAAIVFAILSAMITFGIYMLERQGLVSYTIRAGVFTDWLQFVVLLGLIVLPLQFAVQSISEGFSRARRDEKIMRERNLELEAIRTSLEKRTQQLEHRARYLEATTAVAKDAASILDLQELASEVVNLISEQFGFYHTGLFLVDETKKWAILQAASSDGGKTMLARGHRLRVGQEGIVGYVTSRGEPRIALDVGEDAVYFDNPDLPETRSEMALPLEARGAIIGALDVQSKQPQAFSDEDVAVLQTMATQIAMAISNAGLFQQVQASLATERRAYGQISQEGWRRFVQTRSAIGYRYKGGTVSQLAESASMEQSDELPKLEIPIRVLGRKIGTINAHKANPDDTWTDEENEMMATLAQQMGSVLESARLYEDTQRRAAREHLTSEITDKMRRAAGVDRVIETALEELHNALGTSRVFVQLKTTSPEQERHE